MTTQILIGFLSAVMVAFLAHKVHSLSRSGFLAAALIGTIIFGLGGWRWAVLLLTFFVSSSAMTRLFKKRKATLDEKFAKGGQRDAGQVFANGGIAAIFAAVSIFFPAASWPWWGFAASLAAVTADTWATELGVLNPSPPRLIVNGRPVERGTSGAVSLYGTLSALAGAALISIFAVLLSPALASAALLHMHPFLLFVLVALSGLLGALFDSLLGATVQAIYHCQVCGKETERHPLHLCGTQTTHIRGWKWLDNDLVNVGCAVFGAVAMVVMVLLA